MYNTMENVLEYKLFFKGPNWATKYLDKCRPGKKVLGQMSHLGKKVLGQMSHLGKKYLDKCRLGQLCLGQKSAWTMVPRTKITAPPKVPKCLLTDLGL